MSTQRIHSTIFANIGHKLASNIPSTDTDPIQFVQPCRSVSNQKTIAKTDLIQIIEKIKANKAPGLDKISNQPIKLAGEAIHD